MTTADGAIIIGLIWAVVALAAVWVGYDARRYQIPSTSKPYSINNGATASALSGPVVFFSLQFLFGIWLASALWLAVFAAYIARRSRVLLARSRVGQPMVPLPPLPVLPPPEPLLDRSLSNSGLDDPLAQAKVEPAGLRGICQHCGQHLEFDAEMAGQFIDCPHCKKPTKLAQRPGPPNARPEANLKSLPVGIPVRRGTQSAANPPPPEQATEAELKRVARLKDQGL